MKPLTLSARIMMWAAALVASALLLVGAAAIWFVHHEQISQLDRELEAEGHGFLEQWRLHGGPGFPWEQGVHEVREWLAGSESSLLVEVTDEKGKTLFRSESLKDGRLREEPSGFHDLHQGGQDLRVAVFQEEAIVLRMASDTAVIRQLTQRLIFLFLLMFPLALVFVFMGGRWIARSAMAPIREITAAAEKFSSHHLDKRVPIPVTRDEVQRLAIVLNETFDRLDLSFNQAIRFSADASHELKTPLTVMRTGIERLLHSDDLTEVDERAVAGLLEQTTRLSSITANLLLLSRADAGKLTLDLAPCDLSEIVGLCVDDARILAEPEMIRITSELPSVAMARVDRTRTAQIVMNLLDNAVNYNQAHGMIHVSLDKEAGWWRFLVANSGPGISAETVAGLFTRFFRGEHSSEVGGHGLGLSLSRELARAQGGDILLDSAAGDKSTRFKVMFPDV